MMSILLSSSRFYVTWNIIREDVVFWLCNIAISGLRSHTEKYSGKYRQFPVKVTSQVEYRRSLRCSALEEERRGSSGGTVRVFLWLYRPLAWMLYHADKWAWYCLRHLEDRKQRRVMVQQDRWRVYIFICNSKLVSRDKTWASFLSRSVNLFSSL